MTGIEIASGTWQTIQRVLMQRLARVRNDLERDKNEAETARLRGQIREIKFLLSLPAAEDDAPADGDEPTA